MGAGEGARNEQQGGPRGGCGFGGGWLTSRCREARVGGGGGWCALPEAWGFGWSGWDGIMWWKSVLEKRF